jgi:hypothetical protein
MVDRPDDRAPAPGNVVAKALLNDASEGHYPLFAPFPTDAEVASGQEIADPEVRDFRQPKSGIEEQHKQRPVTSPGSSQEALDVQLVKRRHHALGNSGPGDALPGIDLEHPLPGEPGEYRLQGSDVHEHAARTVPLSLQADNEGPRFGLSYRRQGRIGVAPLPEDIELAGALRITLQGARRQAARFAGDEIVLDRRCQAIFLPT